jgi:F-type H+-transporting ATPase subunit b
LGRKEAWSLNTLAIGLVLASEEMEPRLFNLDLQLIADSALMIIAVFALFLIASHLLFNPVRDMLQNRQNRIKNELDTAASDMENARVLKAEYEAKLKDIDKEAETILAEARKKALANENRIVSEAKEEAARIIERANTEAELEKKKAADDVKREMVVLASMLAGKVVNANIDTTVQDSLIDETLKEMGESTWLS